MRTTAAGALSVAPGKKVGLFLATMMVVSNIVGSGIFLLPASMAAFGSLAIVGWLIATAGAVLVALVLSKLAQNAPERGGPVAYAAKALGPFMGYQATTMYWLSCLAANVAIAITAVGYAATFFPWLAAPRHAAVGATLLIWALMFANRFGARLVCQLEAVTLIAGLIPIVVVAAGGWFAFHPAILAHSWNVSGRPALRVIPESVVLAFWAFTGLESASIATAVVEAPERNVARATLGGVLLSALLFLASSGVMMGMIPAAALARSTAPFADAVRMLLGPAAAGLVALLAMLKVGGMLGGWILVTAETAHAGAEQGLFPALFARQDAQGRPMANLLCIAAIMTVLVWVSVAPTLGQQFAQLIEASTILCLLLYVYACLAVWHYRRRAPQRYRGTRTIAALAMAVCLAGIVCTDRTLLAISAGLVFLSYPFYPLCSRGAE